MAQKDPCHMQHVILNRPYHGQFVGMCDFIIWVVENLTRDKEEVIFVGGEVGITKMQKYM